MHHPYHLPAEVDRIAELHDPVLRNLQITQSYAELSAQIAGRTGRCANWCTFATWASRQAGQSIRREDVRAALEQVLNGVPEIQEAMQGLVAMIRQKRPDQDAEGIRALVWELLHPAAALERAGEAVARGNQKVYAEIGRAFAGFLDACLADPAPNPDHLSDFCNRLRIGDPPDGQDYLRRAFTRYYQAFFVQDAREKAQLLLLANLEIGFHEQTRLQPEIAAALEAAVVDPQDFSQRLFAVLFPNRSRLAYAIQLLLHWLGQRTAIDRGIEQLLQRIRHHLRLFLTDHLMSLRFPAGKLLQLGHDLPGTFPENLRQLDNAELLALLARLDPTPNDLRDSGATDWADLQERLHYIADMFRCSQEEVTLLEAPFTAEELEKIKSGVWNEEFTVSIPRSASPGAPN